MNNVSKEELKFALKELNFYGDPISQKSFNIIVEMLEFEISTKTDYGIWQYDLPYKLSGIVWNYLYSRAGGCEEGTIFADHHIGEIENQIRKAVISSEREIVRMLLFMLSEIELEEIREELELSEYY